MPQQGRLYKLKGVEVSLSKDTSLRQQSCQFSKQIASLPKLIKAFSQRLKKQRDAQNIFDVVDLNPRKVSSDKDPPQDKFLQFMKMYLGVTSDGPFSRSKVINYLFKKAMRKDLNFFIQFKKALMISFEETLIQIDSVEKSMQKSYRLGILSLKLVQSFIYFFTNQQSREELKKAIIESGIYEGKASILIAGLFLNMK